MYIRVTIGKGRSVSYIVENYLKEIIKEESTKVIDSTPITSSLIGSFKATTGFDYKEELTKGIRDTHFYNQILGLSNGAAIVQVNLSFDLGSAPYFV